MKNETSFMPHRKLFSPDDKMSDILQSNYRLLPLLSLRVHTGRR